MDALQRAIDVEACHEYYRMRLKFVCVLSPVLSPCYRGSSGCHMAVLLLLLMLPTLLNGKASLVTLFIDQVFFNFLHEEDSQKYNYSQRHMITPAPTYPSPPSSSLGIEKE